MLLETEKFGPIKSKADKGGSILICYAYP